MKRAVAACCLLAVLLLSGSGQPQPAAAMSKFCRCYKQCYADCRKSAGPYPCDFECMQDCVNGQPPPPAQPAAPVTAADCGRVCAMVSICGAMEMEAGGAMPAGAAAPGGGGDAEACVPECAKSIGGASAPSAAAKIVN